MGRRSFSDFRQLVERHRSSSAFARYGNVVMHKCVKYFTTNLSASDWMALPFENIEQDAEWPPLPPGVDREAASVWRNVVFFAFPHTPLLKAEFREKLEAMEEMTDATRLPAVDAVICVIPAKAGFELPPRLLDSKYVTSLRILVSLVCRI